MAIIGFSHLSLEVDAPEASARFFAELLGMRLVRQTPARTEGRASGAASKRTASVLLVGEGLHLELRSPDETTGGTHASRVGDGVCLSFLADDLASTLHSLRDRGAELVGAPRGETATGFAAALVRAPGGILVELVQRPSGVATAFDEVDRR